jgi:hypothetical protein
VREITLTNHFCQPVDALLPFILIEETLNRTEVKNMDETTFLINGEAIVGHSAMWIVRLKSGNILPSGLGDALNEFRANLLRDFRGESYKNFTEEELSEFLRFYFKVVPLIRDWFEISYLKLDALVEATTASLIKEFSESS